MTPPTRQRLPNRRRSDLVAFEYEGVPYRVQYSFGPQGLSEIFVDAAKEGSTANIVARECAVILSLALQFGTPLDVIAAALPKLADGSPAGPMGKALEEIDAAKNS